MNKKTNKPLVSIVMGSFSDMPVMQEAANILEEYNVPYEMNVYSAHRTPQRTIDYARKLDKSGIEVIIAGAGAAAHLAGLLAALTILPVIGVPLDGSPLKGLDSLYSIVQMPAGVPVATMAIGKAGVKNAAFFALEILALKNLKLKNSLIQNKKRMEEDIIKKAKEMQKNKK